MPGIPDESHDLFQPPTDPEHMVPPGDPLVLAHFIAEAIRDLAEDIHVHRWDILDRWIPSGRPVHPRTHMGLITFVLVRCQECNLPQSVELDGDWTLEQIRKQINVGEEGENGN